MLPRDNARTPSGRFLLRIEPGFHATLRRAASETGLSLNEYCARKLAAPTGSQAVWLGAGEAVQRAAELFGAALVGVVVFGSWARGEEREDSDIDVLVVIDEEVAITRALYRRWDAAPVSWDGHRVEPHFVHLPVAGRTVAGLWAEVAMEGIVLFVRDRELPARLARVRGDVADGKIVRRRVQGQPYWVEAA